MVKDYFKDQNIPVAEVPQPESRFGSDVMRNVKELQVGSGSTVFRADRSGIWLGAAKFEDAPFSVDMDGNIVATGLTLGSLAGDLDDIADGSTYAKTTLTGALGAGYAYTGLNTSGEIIKGFLNTQLSAKSLPTNGVRVDSSGIYGRKSSVTTFYISSAGDAYFSGDIFGSTITGGLLQTASSGIRTVIDGSDSKIKFMSGSSVWAYVYPFNYGGSLGNGVKFATTNDDAYIRLIEGTHNIVSLDNSDGAQVTLYDASVQISAPDVIIGTDLTVTDDLYVNGTFFPNDGIDAVIEDVNGDSFLFNNGILVLQF